ncbi:MAG: hypothetical protein AABW87_02405 [Nanoarchaeota archaeon]
MLLVKLFGFLDFVSALHLILLKWGLLNGEIAWIVTAFLLLKSLIFIGDVVSVMDFFAVICLVLALIGFYTPFNWIFILWLLQKSFFSLIA